MNSPLTIRHWLFWRRVIPAENIRAERRFFGWVFYEKLPGGFERIIPNWKIVSRVTSEDGVDD